MSKKTNRNNGTAKRAHFKTAGLSVLPKTDLDSPAPTHLLDYAGLYTFLCSADLTDDELIAYALGTFFEEFAPVTMAKYFTFDFMIADDDDGENVRLARPTKRVATSPAPKTRAAKIREFRMVRSLLAELAALSGT